jgi:hypothetical protein
MEFAMPEFTTPGSAGLIPEIAVKTLALGSGVQIRIPTKGGTTARTPIQRNSKIVTSSILKNWGTEHAIRRRTTVPNATTMVEIAVMTVATETRADWRDRSSTANTRRIFHWKNVQ